MSIHLILGGARSGKSAYAEKLAFESAMAVVYIATAQVIDDEFKQRVDLHKAGRPRQWRTIEAPHHLADALLQASTANNCIVIDCLTLWLAQCICPECTPSEGIDWLEEQRKLLEALYQIKNKVILVSNEVGMGIVPLGAINRQFQDEQGRLNQAVAKLADEVYFIAAGLPLKLKG
ncbi:MAG: bifunctional adenosylcobinamide kinase/adenosylcobinamide-phosphate guanylyltransferase [Methylophilaceae bacterium]